MYPDQPGGTIDKDYYVNSHMKFVSDTIGENLLTARIVEGLGTPDPETPAPYKFIAILEFKSIEALHNWMAENSNLVKGDVANFSNVEPVVQFSKNLD